MLPVIAIVGRPNTGKSTLFNRLIEKRKALVHDRPGVTRDRNYETMVYADRQIMIVDTGGFDPDAENDLLSAMRGQVELAIEEADAIIFLVDRKAGLTPADRHAAQVLRNTRKPVFLVVNKVDSHLHESDMADFWELGMTEMYPMSAEHGRGIMDLMDAIMPTLPAADPEEDDQDEGLPLSANEAEMPSQIRLAILGRPNVGKSTLANRLLGEERHLVHDAPGTTMDAVDSPFTVDGREFLLVDTAGIRRKARIEDKVESMAVAQAIHTIERCHVTLFVLDGTEAPSAQDSRLVRLAEERGRALVFLVNRWDLVQDMEGRSSEKIEEEIRETFPHASWAPIIFISALTGKGCHRIMPTVDQVFESFNRHISTSTLNRLLRDIETVKPPPQRYHHPIRIHYATQARVRPPSFVFFSNVPEAIPDSYKRFLANQLRDNFHFEGTPIRIDFKQKRKLEGLD